ncbi:hypothetical protein H8E50_13190, partial [bacterium]|nr:hypothetical protein [bacterium]
MKIAFLIPDANGPSTRYRVLKYIPYIEKDGHETDVFIIRKGLWQRYLLFKNLRKYDVVFLHRKLFRYIDLHMLRKYVRRLIYDFDDAVMFRDPNSAKQFSRTRSAAFKCTVKNADLVIAGNEYLRAMALEVNPSTILIPTSL